MGWIAVYKNGKIDREEDPGVGRPVQAGDNGELLCIAQEDYGHKVAVNLISGLIVIDYETLGVQNETLELTGVRTVLAICEGDTNIVAEYQHMEEILEPWYNCFKTKFVDVPLEDGTVENREVRCDDGSTFKDQPCENGHPRLPMIGTDGKQVVVKTQILHPLLWRPIWFTRHTNLNQTKVIGAQTTTPKEMGERNVQKVVSLFASGVIGVD